MGQSIAQMLGGSIVSLVTCALFWYCLPREGKASRIVDTRLGPFISVAFCAGFGLSATMVLAGALGFFSGR